MIQYLDIGIVKNVVFSCILYIHGRNEKCLYFPIEVRTLQSSLPLSLNVDRTGECSVSGAKR